MSIGQVAALFLRHARERCFVGSSRQRNAFVNDKTVWLYDRQAPGAALAAQAAAFFTHSECDAVVRSNDLAGFRPQIRALPGLAGRNMIAVWTVRMPATQAPPIMSAERPIAINSLGADPPMISRAACFRRGPR